MIDLKAIGELIDWMIDGARAGTTAPELVESVCSTLVKAGIPVDRFALFIYTLDPTLIGHRFAWTPDGGAICVGRPTRSVLYRGIHGEPATQCCRESCQRSPKTVRSGDAA
jgi:hypothetical protein